MEAVIVLVEEGRYYHESLFLLFLVERKALKLILALLWRLPS